MKLREYIFRITAVVLFVSAGFVYVFMSENSKNTVYLEINRNTDRHAVTQTDGNLDDNGLHNADTDVHKSAGQVSDVKKTAGQASDLTEKAEQPSGSEGTDPDGTTLYSGAENGEISIQDGLIDINLADRTKLMELPGIGPAKADAIIAYRNENGRFSSIEELMQVPGIKEGTFIKLKDHIYVSYQGL